MTNITELKEKLIAKVKTQSGTYQDQKTITALLSIIEEMQKCIEFYGNTKSWNDSFDLENRVNVIDILDVSKTDYPENNNAKFGGKRARKTLTATEQKLKNLTEKK